MGRVTTVLIYAEGLYYDDDDESRLPQEIVELNRLIAEDDHRTESIPEDGCSFRNLVAGECSWGGTKWPVDLYGGAINYLSWRRFRDTLRAIRWPQPAHVQVMVLEEEDSVFRVYTLKDLAGESSLESSDHVAYRGLHFSG